MNDDHLRELESVGLLVAGALSPGERAAVQQHLRSCESCRDELVDGAALPGLLRRLGDEPAPVPTPPAARARLVTAAQTHTRRRRRQRRLVGGAALAVTGLLASALLLGVRAPVPAGPALVAMERANSSVQVDGSLAATPRSWGTEIEVQVRWAKQAPAVLVAVGLDGEEQQAGAWAAPAGQLVRCSGATSMRPEAVDRWEVRTADGAPLLVLDA